MAAQTNLLKGLWTGRRSTAGAALYWSGLGRAFEFLSRPSGAIVLMYHSVAPDESASFIDPANRIAPETFERHMRFLSAHRRVVPYSSMVEELIERRTPPCGTVCLTFDDGYLDVLTTAAPILEKYRLPATLFLATGYVERSEMQWADELHFLFSNRSNDHLSVPVLGIHAANLEHAADRAEAQWRLHGLFLISTLHGRRQLLDDIRRQLAPRGEPPRLTLDWNDVRELQRRYPMFDFGGHTRDHLDLSTHFGDVADLEIAGCADDLRRELQLEPRHFSFPYGRSDAESVQRLSAAGWTSALSAGDRFRIDASTDLFAIPRVEGPATMTDLRFKTSGAYPGVLSYVGLR